MADKLRGGSTVGGNIIWHAGNSNSTSIPWSASTVTATAFIGDGSQLTNLPATYTPPTDQGADKFLSGDGTYLPAGGGLGVGQTWQNVTASRSAGVTYTNTTGNAIAIAIVFISAYYNFSLLHDGTYAYVFDTHKSGYDESTFAQEIVLKAIIPDNFTYQFTSNGNVMFWQELR